MNYLKVRIVFLCILLSFVILFSWNEVLLSSKQLRNCFYEYIKYKWKNPTDLF